MDDIWISFLMFFLLTVFALAVYAISNRSREITGPATIVSRRMEPGKWGAAYSDNWNRMITFRLTGGEEVELFVSKTEYDELTDGTQGQLTWDKDTLVHFEPDPAV